MLHLRNVRPMTGEKSRQLGAVCACVRVREVKSKHDPRPPFFFYHTDVEDLWWQGWTSSNKASASQQSISTARLSASEYKSESKEQQTKEEGTAKWTECTGLLVTMTEGEDFIVNDGNSKGYLIIHGVSAWCSLMIFCYRLRLSSVKKQGHVWDLFLFGIWF